MAPKKGSAYMNFCQEMREELEYEAGRRLDTAALVNRADPYWQVGFFFFYLFFTLQGIYLFVILFLYILNLVVNYCGDVQQG